MRLILASLAVAMSLSRANAQEAVPEISQAPAEHIAVELFHVYCWRAGELVQSFEYITLFVCRRSFLSVIDDAGNHRHFGAMHNTQCEVVPISETLG